MLKMKDSVDRASGLLSHYKSWELYCDSFTPGNSLHEGTFAIARHYQLEVAKTQEQPDSYAFCTPIAGRTRNKDRQKGNVNFHLTTQTKSKGNPFRDLSISPDSVDEILEDDDDDGSDQSNLSPFNPTSPMSVELANILYPPTKDEQIVNTALIVFLNALTIHFSLSLNWTLHRKSFTAVFEDAEFQARTDGYLSDAYGKPSVLIEVKPFGRARKLDLIQIQESAQMVAWIKSDGDSAQKRHKRRLHISQDRHKVFVTVAEYDEEYIKYINNKHSLNDPPSFLVMHQFGPWDTLRKSHMRELGPILLAISLQADDESKAASLLF